MSEITITINGRNYDISCDAGEEGRVLDLATYVDQQVREIARSGAAYNDSHLLILASLFLANEVMEARSGITPASNTGTDNSELGNNSELEEALAAAQEELERLKAEREEILAVTENLNARVEGLTKKISSL